MIVFQKMNGLGNSFIYFCELYQDLSIIKHTSSISRLCSVSSGLGADGVIFVKKPQDFSNHCYMQIFNSDGTEAEMCGNAIRGVAYYYQQFFPGVDPVLVETKAGLKTVCYDGAKNGQPNYNVDMGKAVFDLFSTGELLYPALKDKLIASEKQFEPVYVNIGNPHAVNFVDPKMTYEEMLQYGPILEKHSFHPKGMNIEFVKISSRARVYAWVWERGCGMTQACGTGATAIVAAGIKHMLLDDSVEVVMPGGSLHISKKQDYMMNMSGPIQYVAQGHLAAEYFNGLLST